MDNDKFQELIIKKLEEQDNKQDKFQELVIKQFGEINSQFGNVFEQLDRLEIFAKQHHEELELVARQVETQEIKDISKSKFYLVKVPE